MTDNDTAAAWVVYILRCADDTLYTGITSDMERRLREHNGEIGNGAKYTRGRTPVSVAWSEPACDRAGASRREAEIKRLSRAEKQLLIDTMKKCDHA